MEHNKEYIEQCALLVGEQLMGIMGETVIHTAFKLGLVHKLWDTTEEEAETLSAIHRRVAKHLLYLTVIEANVLEIALQDIHEKLTDVIKDVDPEDVEIYQARIDAVAELRGITLTKA